MAERKVDCMRISRIRRALKLASVAEKGQIACIDTADGALVASSVVATLVPIGYFEESFTGDGTRVCSVRLFEEITVQCLTASATGAPVNADMLKVVYVRTSPEVSTTATSSSVAGRFWGLTSNGLCMVQMFINGGAVS